MWGFCAEVIYAPGNPEVLMRASIGDRVRAGHDEALDLVLAEANRELALRERVAYHNAPPFEYVSEGDVVLLQARFCPDELNEHDRFWIARDFESILVNHVPDDLFQEHMEAVHVEDDEDCVCDGCLQQ